jgi:hypothetical protein
MRVCLYIRGHLVEVTAGTAIGILGDDIVVAPPKVHVEFRDGVLMPPAEPEPMRFYRSDGSIRVAAPVPTRQH